MQDIPGYPGYKITKRGTIYSFRKPHGGVREEIKVLKWQIQQNGRAHVTLYNGAFGKQLPVHRLVALTYIPNPDKHPIVMHRDNDPLNNHYKNLKWGTYAENTQQCVNEGRHIKTIK